MPAKHSLHRFGAAALGVALLSITACADDAGTEDPATSEEESASATLAGSDHLGGAQLQLATANDMWAEHGIDVDMQRFASGRDALNAVLGGTAEIGAVGDLPAVTAVLADENIRILGALSYGTDWRVLTTEASGIEGPEDLEGLRIGVPQGTNAQYLLGLVLSSADLSEDDVEIVNLGPNQVPSSLASGDIDAGLTFPTFWSAAENALGDDFASFIFDDYQSATLLIARDDADEENVRRVVEALVSAEGPMDEDTQAAQTAVSEGSDGEISVEQVQQLWDNYDIGLNLDDDLVTALSDEAQWAVDELDIAGDPTFENLMSFTDPEPLSEAKPDAVNLTESE